MAHERIRNLTIIIATRDRQQAHAEIGGRVWEFPYRLAIHIYLVCDAFGLFSIFCRQERCVVGEAFVHQNVEYPFVLFKIELLSRTITYDTLSRRPFDRIIGTAEVVTKFVRSQISRAAVIKSAARDLVPACDDLAHQIRI